jgi:hypothetical protein
VLGYIGHPQAIRAVSAEAPAKRSSELALPTFAPLGSFRFWQTVDPEAFHEEPNLFLADVDATAVSELGGDAQLAVGAGGVFVHLRDLAGKPCVSERPLR